ncbi:hypothetical protein [Xanthomonas prunicola]|uniref:hypothetical protein n=1 Tax=Xanthomonas prunicola TaxID=2053930 RepID=UPI0013001041|nr:hypothetical protein [Xanthomonas prunicola]
MKKKIMNRGEGQLDMHQPALNNPASSSPVPCKFSMNKGYFGKSGGATVVRDDG